MDLALVVSLWLHTLAFVIAWGYYGVLARMILPALARSLEPTEQATVLEVIERRALPLVGVSLVLFFVTGTYLLVSDPKYAGLGHVLASTWTTLMLVKHLLVVVMIRARRRGRRPHPEPRVIAGRGRARVLVPLAFTER